MSIGRAMHIRECARTCPAFTRSSMSTGTKQRNVLSRSIVGLVMEIIDMSCGGEGRGVGAGARNYRAGRERQVRKQ